LLISSLPPVNHSFPCSELFCKLKLYNSVFIVWENSQAGDLVTFSQSGFILLVKQY